MKFAVSLTDFNVILPMFQYFRFIDRRFRSSGLDITKFPSKIKKTSSIVFSHSYETLFLIKPEVFHYEWTLFRYREITFWDNEMQFLYITGDIIMLYFFRFIEILFIRNKWEKILFIWSYIKYIYDNLVRYLVSIHVFENGVFFVFVSKKWVNGRPHNGRNNV